MILSFLKRHWWWIIPLLIFDFFLFRWLLNRSEYEILEKKSTSEQTSKKPPAPIALRYTYPTNQRNLHKTSSLEVYQPTASGRVESALYGSVRTVQRGGRLFPSFHAGLDIAPMQRGHGGVPKDKIYAITDGTVAYINNIGGNSSYGIYIVLLHPDPAGMIYSLYSHLASVDEDLKEGQSLQRGDILGVMGNTASTGIPMHRAHLHFEVGVIKNMRFHSWYRKQNLKSDHGTFHGYNLSAINPLALYKNGGSEIIFNMKDHLLEIPVAFEIIVRHDKPLDYFNRYPVLWRGLPYSSQAMTISVSESGTPLSGRAATPPELEALEERAWHVLRVDEDVLARNGRMLVIRRERAWTLGRNGKRWLRILTY